MRICLLTCSAPFLIDEKVFPPLGLMAVGTALRVQGHDVKITDSPDDSSCFGLGPTTPEYASALLLLRQIRAQNTEARVVIGGPHAVANTKECLSDGFDVVVTGDGENITVDTFRASGVVDLGNGRLIDDYPILDRSLVDIRSYQYKINTRDATTLMTSRGCPYRCGFCAKTESRVRYYSVDRIEREVKYLRDRWGYKSLMIFDDTFILDRERARWICTVLRKESILWRCFVRGDLVVHHQQNFINRMADSGCVEVAIGIESGSDRILKSINKGEDISTVRRAVGMLQKSGIRVKGLFIVGLPGEDWQSVAETQQFIREVPLDDADFTVYQPYRRSSIWDHREDYDVDWDELPLDKRFYKGRSGEYVSTVRTSSLSSEDIVRARDELEFLFRSERVVCQE